MFWGLEKMDWGASIETATLMWIAALIGIFFIILYIFRDWNSSKRMMKAKDIDQQIIKEELRDAKRCARARKSSYLVIQGDLSVEPEPAKKILGIAFHRDFVSIFYLENFWSWAVVDVYRKLAPFGFESKYIRVNGISIRTVKGRGTVIPNSFSGVSEEEVLREWQHFRLENHLNWGISQSQSQLNKGMYDAVVLKGEKGGLLTNVDNYEFKEIAKKGAETFVRN